MSIKQLDKSFLDMLVKFNKEVYGFSHKGIRKYFEFFFKKGKFFGYFDGKKLIGCVGILVHKELNYAEIDNLFVSKSFQRKGIGKELMNFIEKYSKNKLKIKNLRLNVMCKNKKAINFYKKIGYSEQAYIMSKILK